MQPVVAADFLLKDDASSGKSDDARNRIGVCLCTRLGTVCTEQRFALRYF